MKKHFRFLDKLRAPLSGSGNAYVIAIIGAVAAGSYFLTGGLMPHIDQNPINPEHVEIDDSSIIANKDTLQLVNIQPKPSVTPTLPPTTPSPTATTAQCLDKAAVAIVVDTSGSMATVDPGTTKSRMARLQEALKSFVNNFSPDSVLTLISFSGTGSVLVPFDKKSQVEGALNTAIDGLEAGGATNMKNGLEDAITAFDSIKTTYANYNKYTVFMSDGIPESGDCKYRQYNFGPNYDTGPYNWFQSGDPKTTGIVPPYCTLPDTGQQPTFFTHKWSPILPGDVLKNTGKLFSMSMRETPDSSDADYAYDKDAYDKTGDLMSTLASDPSSTYFISVPSTANLTSAYQQISTKICP